MRRTLLVRRNDEVCSATSQMELFTKPSTITKRLKEAGELLGIPVLDHIIIGYSYFSIECNAEYNFEDEEGE